VPLLLLFKCYMFMHFTDTFIKVTYIAFKVTHIIHFINPFVC